MKYKFQVDKKRFNVQIPPQSTFSTETTLKLDKRKMTLSLGETTENEINSIFLDNKLYQIEIEKDNQGYPTGIYVNGEYFSAALLKIDRLFYFRERAVKSSKSGIIRSFLPGNIKKIYYQAGDKVKENDIILIHEAMKMENEIRAPKSGTLKQLGVNEGDNILANHILFEIE